MSKGLGAWGLRGAGVLGGLELGGMGWMFVWTFRQINRWMDKRKEIPPLFFGSAAQKEGP